MQVADTMLLDAEPLHRRHAAAALLGTPAISSLQRPGYLHPTSQD